MSEFTENNNYRITIPNATDVFNNLLNDNNFQRDAQMIEGENGMYSYTSTGNKNLDFFSKLARNSSSETIIEMFKNAYNEDKVTALQIMMNYRDRNGKQEKNIGRVIMSYLKEHCPYTYCLNLLLFVENGYIKDLSELYSMKPNVNNIADGIEANIYSKLLEHDKQVFEENEKNQISLAAKWAPRENSKYPGLAKEIASILTPNGNLSKQLKVYRKSYLTPLNKKLNTLERNLSSKEYENIKIEQIPGTALKKTKKGLIRNMPEKYEEFLNKCRTGEVKMKTTGIQPHELIREIESGNETSEIQLNQIIENLRESGVFENTLPVSDVSGSMSGIPMEVSVALGFVLSQLQNDEFKDKLITFSGNPTLHNLTGNTTKDKLSSIRRMDWGGNTDFIKMFEMLLQDAITRRITEDKMVKQIIVFTDMEFDCAHAPNCNYSHYDSRVNQNSTKYNTGYEIIKRKYEENGLTLPKIVFWNLRDSTTSFPVRQDTPGVALMNGFSSEMLKLFMEDGEITPLEIMKKAICKYNVINLNEEIN